MFKRIYVLGISLILSSIPSVNARVNHLEITEIISIAGGKHFGDIGAYEKVSGIAYFDISPDHKRNQTITDISRVGINAEGNIEFSAEFEILRPVDPSKANGILFVEAPSQGEKLSLGLLHDIDQKIDLNFIGETTDLGNGFLFERGHTIAWIAWQAQIERVDHRLVVDFPAVLENDQPVTGFILTEFNGRSFKDQNPYTLPLSGRDFVTSFPTISTDKETAKASLFVMESGSAGVSSSEVQKGEEVPADQWQFAHCPNGWPGEPSSNFICVKNGFLKNRNYHLIYQAVGSPVMGLGLATTRDFISYLRHEDKDRLGNQNPISHVKHVICQGIGQGAKYLRDFLYQGFNVDLNDQKVCDGMSIHAAGAEKTYLNYRFSQPYRVSTQHSERFIPDMNFPRQYSVRVNPFLKFPDGILKKPVFDPYIFHTDTSTQYWQSRASLVGASEGGTMDFSESSRVRKFLISGAESYNRFNSLAHNGYGERQCLFPSNNLHIGALMRALMSNLEYWVTDGGEPLDSIYPKIHNETLVEAKS
ncbi:MAG: alpha/beta hydrolase domain-containing protein, partial [Proteobacteria bacterium]|nr:alpha/beta hydrolase domain-containing protein [Pseudomonadota bacterium]